MDAAKLLLFFVLTAIPTHCYVIEGVISAPSDAPPSWYVHTKVQLDGSQHIGFVRSDGSFKISNVPSGSYLLEPVNPSYVFQPARVDINSKGRIRARRVNAPQPNAVKELPYPLRLSSLGKAMYFKPREQLRTIDLLLSPNVLYVVVPLLLYMLLTKCINTNDPEFQELQQMSLLNNRQNVPDMSEVLSSISLFGGAKKPSVSGTSRRRAVEHDESSSKAVPNSPSDSAQTSSHSVSGGRKSAKRRNQ